MERFVATSSHLFRSIFSFFVIAYLEKPKIALTSNLRTKYIWSFFLLSFVRHVTASAVFVDEAS